MTAPRKASSDLAKQFQASASPVYLINAQRRIVYCNLACAQWCGTPPEMLIGQVCNYQSATGSPAERAAAMLCPPPAALAGQMRRGEISAASAGGEIRRRSATFTPLVNPDGALSLLVIAADKDEAAASEADLAVAVNRDETSAELHARIQQLNRQWLAANQSNRLFGDSLAMRRVRALIDVAAGCRASVLIVGPVGSGRQHAARAIHANRSGQPIGNFVPLACNLLSGEVLRSQLMTLNPKRSAAGNEIHTLLLTEVDRLPGEVFPELLVALRADSPRLRIVSTASQSLSGLVTSDEMPAELASGLSTLLIEIPSLAARREDIPLLCQAFVEEQNALGEKQIAGVAPDALDRLAMYPWPGNVAELVEIIGTAYDQAEGSFIAVADLPPRISQGIAAVHRSRRADEPIVLDEFLAEVENEVIRRALARAKGNKAKAARLLGLTRPRLYRRMIQLGLAVPSDAPEFTPLPDEEAEE